MLVVVFEHNGKARPVIKGATVDFEDVAWDPRRIDGFVAVAEPSAIVSPGAFDIRFASAVIALIAEKEHREQQTKFSLLISQIDPHFICNTINSINYLARKGRCDDVITVNTALMTILRDRLRVNDIEITDSIANEIRVVEQYIVIQRFMYGGDLQFCWQVEEMLREEQIPKNMIQPLVENSLFHGLINEESGEINGEIRISIEKTEQGILLRVSDNGAGMDKARLEQVRRAVKLPEERGNKIGLSNIRARLYYLYGSADGMTIQSALGQGTTITILFPTK